MDSRKQAVSIRMNRSDVRNVKRVAERLGARDSDVIRFAIKVALGKLALLQDPSVRGRSLVPVFLEAGPELIRHFELDYARLAAIINEGVEPDNRVDPEDIQLLAMHGLQRAYLKLRVVAFRRQQGADPDLHAGVTNGSTGSVELHSSGRDAVDEGAVEESLRRYFYDKYVYAAAPAPAKLANDR